MSSEIASPANYREWASFHIGGADSRAVGIVNLHGLGADRFQTVGYHDSRINGSMVRTLIPDARDHGESTPPETIPLSFGQAAEDLHCLIHGLGFAREIVLIGVSMGAGTALRATIEARFPIVGLVLVRPAWLNEPNPHNLEPFRLIADLMEMSGPVLGAEKFDKSAELLRVARVSQSSAESLKSQFQRPMAYERRHRLWQMPASVPFDTEQDLGKIDVPTLIIGAPEDPIHPLEIARTLWSAIPGAQWYEATSRDTNPVRYEADIRGSISGFMEQLRPSLEPR